MTSARSSGALRLNPSLDRAALRARFDEHGRVHVAQFLRPEDALRLHARLAEPDGWAFVFNRGNTHFELTQEQARRMPAEGHRQMMADIMGEARDGFQLAYEVLNITKKGRDPLTDDPMLVALHALVNGREFLDFIKAVTGEDRAGWSDCTGTRYRPGNFCEAHNDHAYDGDRLIAYVLNLTPRWRPDWGGILQFIDEDGHISEGFTPTFNAINLFRVPQQHAVSIVAPFAGAERLSFTGWVRAA